jgi:chemotaxis family two-component system response regulator Rcp1
MLNLLLVEDDPADVRLMREALSGWTIPHTLHVVANGEDALHFMQHSSPHGKTPRPDLVLLDLNLPKIPGLSVLKSAKQTPLLRNIPIIVMSNSRQESDIRSAYDLQASAYIVKRLSYDDTVRVFNGIEAFWLKRVVFPRKPDTGGSTGRSSEEEGGMVCDRHPDLKCGRRIIQNGLLAMVSDNSIEARIHTIEDEQIVFGPIQYHGDAEYAHFLHGWTEYFCHVDEFVENTVAFD